MIEVARLGRYRLVQRVGEGGMGVVHLGLDPDGTTVAVKVLRPHVAGDPQARERLAREVSTLQRVRHPRVAEVLDADTDGDQPYVVTRYVPAPPLDDRVRLEGPLAGKDLARLGDGLGEALAAIHAAGVVHRDLKPGNVLMLDGEPVVIDFGIAHVADEVRLTSTGLVMGTPGYLSPEVLDGDAVSQATDWWGWAATMAFAATGRPPFGRGPVEAVLGRVRSGPIDLDGVPGALVPVLRAALSADPADRPEPAALRMAVRALWEESGGWGSGWPPEEPRTQVLDGADTARTTALRTPATRVLPAGAPVPFLDVPPSVDGRPAYAEFHEPPPTSRAPAPVHDRRPALPLPPPPGQPPAQPPHPAQRGVPSQHWAPPQQPAHQQQRWPQPQPSAPPVARHQPVPQPAAPQHAVPQHAVPQPAAPQPAAPQQPVAPPPQHPAILARPVLTAGVLTLCAVAAVAPVATAIVGAGWMVLARTVTRVHGGVLRRRFERGPRRADVVLAALSSPWHLVTSALSSVFALVLPLLVAASTTFIVGLLLDTSSPRPGQALPLAAGALAAVLVAWWGPGGSSLRRGSRLVAAGIAPRPAARTVVVAFLLLVCVAAVLVLLQADWQPDWSPLNGPPLTG